MSHSKYATAKPSEENHDGADEVALEEAKPLRAHEQIKALEQDLLEAKTQADDYKDKALRAIAELENTKRRAERDVASAHKYALERFIDQLIPVLDSLEQALLAIKNEDAASMRQGIELTLKMFAEVLAKFGVIAIDPQGQLFNPQLHEAMSMQESAEHPNNTVIHVLQKGYQLNERVVRPARVMVVKNPS